MAAPALLAAYGVQTYYSVVHCHSAPLGLWAATT